MSRNEIKEGVRVICRAIGPYDGARGKVLDVFNGQLVVEMQESTICEPITSFERV